MNKNIKRYLANIFFSVIIFIIPFIYLSGRSLEERTGLESYTIGIIFLLCSAAIIIFLLKIIVEVVKGRLRLKPEENITMLKKDSESSSEGQLYTKN